MKLKGIRTWSSHSASIPLRARSITVRDGLAPKFITNKPKVLLRIKQKSIDLTKGKGPTQIVRNPKEKGNGLGTRMARSNAHENFVNFAPLVVHNNIGNSFSLSHHAAAERERSIVIGSKGNVQGMIVIARDELSGLGVGFLDSISPSLAHFHNPIMPQPTAPNIGCEEVVPSPVPYDSVGLIPASGSLCRSNHRDGSGNHMVIIGAPPLGEEGEIAL
ncbi:hypothetical protein JCGZ_23641 [Jatropha curcas]|uniref:Uncharacterized protein n=1 Tax=Jatropha curcas TaxID=180498 RepID=A0A067L2N4_JATCU|nr:hypothetical protein JCGZ_23641 [Jatropha curcas]